MLPVQCFICFNIGYKVEDSDNNYALCLRNGKKKSPN